MTQEPYVSARHVFWLALHLAGEVLPRGAHLENLVLADVLARSGSVTSRPNILHWRTTTGAEVDFVLELPELLLPVEVKASARVSLADARHLRTFLADYPDQARGALLLYDGDDVFWIERGVLAVPWHRVI